MSSVHLTGWILFHVFVVAMLLLDLLVFHRKEHEIKLKEALVWSVIWILLAFVFNGFIYFWHGYGPDHSFRTFPFGRPTPASIDAGNQFLTGYLIERSLSIDNIFVFILIFSYFRVPAKYHHKILFWGILGALIMRGLFILAGVTLIKSFGWVLYVFGAFLIYTGIKMAMHSEVEIHPERSRLLRIAQKVFRVVPGFAEGRFFVRQDGKLFASMMFMVLLFVEATDVVFAVDSIPAILGITQNSFIIYTSNVFAIFGLRALYFAMAALVRLFHYLNYGLSAILIFIGAKMMIEKFLHIPVWVALTVVAVILTFSIIASVIWPQSEKEVEKLVGELEEEMKGEAEKQEGDKRKD